MARLTLTTLRKDLKTLRLKTLNLTTIRSVNFGSPQKSPMRLDNLNRDVLGYIGQIGEIGTDTLTTKALIRAENKRRNCIYLFEKILGILSSVYGRIRRPNYDNYIEFLRNDPETEQTLQKLYERLIENRCFINFRFPRQFKNFEYALELLKFKDNEAGKEFMWRIFDAINIY